MGNLRQHILSRTGLLRWPRLLGGNSVAGLMLARFEPKAETEAHKITPASMARRGPRKQAAQTVKYVAVSSYRSDDPAKGRQGEKIVKYVAVIPARLASTRLPRKPLREIAGKSMIARVYEAVTASKLVSETIVATDAREVVEHCEKLGIPARMTSPAHRSGTDRVHEIAGSVEADAYINIQGDEPLTRAEHLDALIRLMQQPGVEVGTLKIACAVAEVANPHVVKVVCDVAGRALYFSRSPIPFDRDRSLLQPAKPSRVLGTPASTPPRVEARVSGTPGEVRYFKHLGLYAYRKQALELFCSWPESALERIERLEQLRFLENGVAVHVAETCFETVGVDTEEDLRRVEQILLARG
jgi:3-deoxy-manno-octulosonate cytidylyltransferase (CMP-KDO synthetase)